MDAQTLKMFFFLFLVLAFASLALWLRRQRRVRSGDASTPMSRCRSAAQGYVRLFGKQAYVGGRPLRAPWTGRPCTWWACMVEERCDTQNGQRIGGNWATVGRWSSQAPLLLEDGTGQVLVAPDDTVLRQLGGERWYGPTAEPELPPRLGVTEGRYRYTEARMDAGDPLYVAGRLSTHSSSPSPSGVQRAAADLLEAWKRDQRGLLARFDADGNGRIDVEEWETARRAAFDEATARLSRDAMQAIAGVSVVDRPTDGSRYVLSPVPEVDDEMLDSSSRPELFLFVVFLGLALWFGAKLA